tara:strand:+ start:2658 stop:2822 length:165 start_codon:yes stop_codon:yes gene_type:complete
MVFKISLDTQSSWAQAFLFRHPPTRSKIKRFPIFLFYDASKEKMKSIDKRNKSL